MQVPSPRDRALLWGLVASLLLHAVLFVPGIRDAFQKLDIELKSEPVIEPIEFTLVSPPENPTPPEHASRFLSTVSSRASDGTRYQASGIMLPRASAEGTAWRPRAPASGRMAAGWAKG